MRCTLLAFFLTLQVYNSIGGEISEFDYSQGDYRYDGGMSKETVLLTTPADHQFTLALQKYYHKSGMPSGSVSRNVILVFYDTYLLERLKAPTYDKTNGHFYGDKLIQSVKPLRPDQDVAQPPIITVRYSKTDGSCVQRSYKYKSAEKQYKKSAHDVVDGKYC